MGVVLYLRKWFERRRPTYVLVYWPWDHSGSVTIYTGPEVTVATRGTGDDEIMVLGPCKGFLYMPREA